MGRWWVDNGYMVTDLFNETRYRFLKEPYTRPNTKDFSHDGATFFPVIENHRLSNAPNLSVGLKKNFQLHFYHLLAPFVVFTVLCVTYIAPLF